ncbi:MAG: hypothetical protein HYR66_12805 [Sphingobacteriales bacterium]|nr:hypothetical protein [Sphingobacteriales bacterium]MBI3720708.1 hypothetical protein [Sphingobacteriales bacterium]
MAYNKQRLAEFNCIGYFYNLKPFAKLNIRTMEETRTLSNSPALSISLNTNSPSSSALPCKSVLLKSVNMKKNVKLLKHAAFIFIAASFLCACSSSKRGCPSNGKNVGAEKLLSGEKVPKAKKFKA